ncbi:MAG TPA: TonB-dependent receptor [Anaerohalosphaeraceae bacterium]|nr:TonB-dependent receptor [Anaerohalosphaeraceae bacterium]HQG05653.1 TonB-dependent receptor [Anaerohalosphaeraceae bacterium]HQI07291.1 TonB-dependent receptor [Anaerohalosphaeraceae bacterium]HQJ67602.1 TonB-dependent receptor [Anaerohalosphaeraceae bacterium]
MKNKRKQTAAERFLRLMPLLAACIISGTLGAQQTDKEAQAEQIRAELSALREELAMLQAQPSEETSVPAASAEKPPVFAEEPEDTDTPIAGVLTQTPRRLSPYTVTTITRRQIHLSQARSLYELLEMYVPNLQMLFTSEHPKTLGLRGIMAHRSNKFLVMVNGRIMNEKTDVGAITELDLPMLTDIHHIDILRGPAAAFYGPSAQSMVIHIVTDSAATFQGEQVTIRGGLIEQFSTFEYKYGKQTGSDQGYFFYAGVSQYNGADADDSPTVFGSKEPVWLRGGPPGFVWKPYPGDEYVKTWFKNLNEMPFDRPKMKLYGQYTDGGFSLWARLTQGGQWIDFLRWWDQRETPDDGLTYSQATVTASYDQELSEDLSIRYEVSYDRFANDNENWERAFLWKSFAEDEWVSSITARWNPHPNHSLAFGGQWTHDEFGKRFDDTPISIQPFGKYQAWGALRVPRWNTDSYAVFGQYQWVLHPQWTLLLAGRTDWHPYTDTLFSPRGTLVFTPSDKDTFKFIVSRSHLTNSAGQMWIDKHIHDMDSPTEKLNAFEWRYERQHNENLWSGASIFLHHFRDVLAEIPDENVGAGAPGGTGSKTVGKMRTWGFELEAGWRKDRLQLNLSHSFTKLLNITDAPPFNWGDVYTWWSQYTVAPFGFGEDLAHWYNHSTKLQAEYALSDKLTLSSTLCILWNNPGGQDWADYRNHLFPNWDYDASFKEPFKTCAYLNLGLEYRWNQNTTVNLTGYNLLGLFDKDLNKRRVGFDDQLPGHYRIQPTAVSGSITCRF